MHSRMKDYAEDNDNSDFNRRTTKFEYPTVDMKGREKMALVESITFHRSRAGYLRGI